MRRAVALLALAAIVLAPSAAAHANYLRSEPAMDSRLDVPPPRVVVVLSERVDSAGSGIDVRDAQGDRVDLDDVHLRNGATPEFTVSLPSDLPDGAYSVRWWAFSSVDQHTTSGHIGFAVGPFDPPASSRAAVSAVDAPSAVARTILYAGFALAFGAAALLVFVEPPRRDLARAAALGTALHLGGVALLISDASRDTGLGAWTLLASETGRVLGFRFALGVAALFLGAVAWARGTRAWTYAAAGALALAGLGNARLGHAYQVGWLGFTVDYVHLVSVSVWVGGLVLLFVLLVRELRGEGSRESMRDIGLRYSRIALPVVLTVALTGILASFLIVRERLWQDPGGVLGSPYGAFLAGKVALAVGMVGLAGLNRYVFLARLEPAGFVRAMHALAHRASRSWIRPLLAPPSDRRDARRAFASIVAVEALFGAAVLVLAGLLTASSPPYTAPDAGSAGHAIQGEGEEFFVKAVLDPPATGGASSTLTFQIYNKAERLYETNSTCGRPDCVHVEVVDSTDPEGGASRRTAVPDERGNWVVEDILFVRAGNHTLRFDIQTAYVYRDLIDVPFVVAGAKGAGPSP